MLLLNLFLAFAWVALRGSATALDLGVGLALGFLVLAVAGPLVGHPGYARRCGRVGAFVAFFAKELVLSSWRVAHHVLTPTHHSRPAIVAVPIDLDSDAQLVLLTSLITLTPGTLSLDVTPDRKTLYVHGMFVDDVERFRRGMREGYVRRVKELLR